MLLRGAMHSVQFAQAVSNPHVGGLFFFSFILSWTLLFNYTWFLLIFQLLRAATQGLRDTQMYKARSSVPSLLTPSDSRIQPCGLWVLTAGSGLTALFHSDVTMERLLHRVKDTIIIPIFQTRKRGLERLNNLFQVIARK